MNAAHDLSRASDALYAIPPDMPRNDWVKAGMGFSAAGGDFDTFDTWSAQAGNYNAAACRDTWRSFKAAPGGVGAGSLFGMARDNGWTDGKPSPRPDSAMIDRLLTKQARKPAKGMAAAEVWGRCEAATYRHGYIVAKGAAGVPLDGLRVVPAGDALRVMSESMAGALVVPCMAADGSLSTLQLIPPPDVAARLKAKGKPGKLNLPDHSVQGWFTVGTITPGGVVYIVEGVGQAWACWQATGAAAVVAFGAGNMGKVAKALREQDPAARLVLVPDTGKEQDAAKIAAAVGAAVAAMPDGWPNNSDVHDLMQAEGGDVLAMLLEDATVPPKPEPEQRLKPVSVFDVMTNPAPPPAFVWDGFAPRGNVTLLGAHGGTGKSTIALMLGVCAALGRPLFGVDTEQSKVIFVSLEDGSSVVRHRLAGICKAWMIDPARLQGLLHIVDGTEHPELFAAETRGAGELTASYHELRKLVQSENIGLVLIDNASDAFGGDEIQRRQVRAFMRALNAVARLTDCAVMLLAHVDKTTSRNKKAEGGEGYSGSTAWHNSARSRLFLTRGNDDLLTLEHQKSNLGRLREPVTLEWLEGGFPQVVANGGFDGSRQQGRADDDRAAALIRLIAEFESRGQYCSPALTSRNHVHAVLKSEPEFQKLKLRPDDTKRIVTQCQRAKWLDCMSYRTPDRKPHQGWTVTNEGRAFAGLSTAPTAPTAPTTEDGTDSAWVAPTAPTYVGGVGESARTHDGANTNRSY